MIARFVLMALSLLAGFTMTPTQAGFRSPESLVQNVYAYYGDRSSALSSGLPHDPETAKQFFDPSLRVGWIRAQGSYDYFVQGTSWKLSGFKVSRIQRQFDKTYVTVEFYNGRDITLLFVVVKGPEGWMISDVQSSHDSLRMFLERDRT